MKNKNKIISTISSIIGILLVVVSISFIYSLIKLNVLKTTYIVVGSIIIFLIDLLLILVLEKNKKINYKKYITMFASIVFIVLYSLGISYAISTVNFVNKITSNNYEYQKYSVIVLKSSNYNKIGDLNNKTIGFLNTNSYLDIAKSTLSEKANINIKTKDYNDSTDMINSLSKSTIDSIVLENSYIDLLKENNSNTFNNTKVIYTFKIRVEKKEKSKENKKGTPFIVYISRIDTYGDISRVSRSDVNILAVINPNTNNILFVSIPRDYYVQLHGTTGSKDKLTHAGIYGIDMSVNTINDILDINIDYYYKVNFTTLVKVIDVIGNIDIYSDKTFTPAANKNCSIIEGTNTVDGNCALAFARERYTYESGDRHRGENQEEVLSAIIKKMSNVSTLTKYKSILEKLDNSFETNMSYDDITSLAKGQISSLKPWNISTYNLDGTGGSNITYSMGSTKLYVMVPDQTTIETAKEKIDNVLNK